MYRMYLKTNNIIWILTIKSTYSGIAPIRDKITKHKVRKEDPYDTPIIYWEEASLRLASTARVSKVTLLTKDSFIFKIGDLHKDDLNRIENMYRKFLEDNGAV